MTPKVIERPSWACILNLFLHALIRDVSLEAIYPSEVSEVNKLLTAFTLHICIFFSKRKIKRTIAFRCSFLGKHNPGPTLMFCSIIHLEWRNLALSVCCWLRLRKNSHAESLFISRSPSQDNSFFASSQNVPSKEQQSLVDRSCVSLILPSFAFQHSTASAKVLRKGKRSVA